MQSHNPQESLCQNPAFSPAFREKTTYSDSSGAIFSMYITRAQKFDEENAENWKGGAEGILVFTGLFASTVAQFISSSFQSLQQDPNAITQSLLSQISQQLPGSPNSTSTTESPSVNAGSFKPPASAVFVNAVWIVSLVLSLTCALMATLLQQWARRYLQLTQRSHPPHVRAHIREYFALGAVKFRVSTFVEALPALLLISVLLFFSGLVVYAFRANNIVAFITLAIVGFCSVCYLALSLAPLICHDCPYQTPLSTLFWFFAQVIPFSVFSIAHYGAKFFCHTLGVGNTDIVERFRSRRINKKETFSRGMLSMLEDSAKRFSLDICRSALRRTLNLLDEDHELEDFVAGIPGLSESEALRTFDELSPNDGGRVVLAALPGPTSFNEQLPWSIVMLSHRAITSGLSELVRKRRTQACLKALYHIPGAIRDILAPYAAGTHYCLRILPLLNSSESLDLIKELWDTTNDDIALSVRCVAAAISAFIITPPEGVLDKFLPPGVQFIGGEKEPGSNLLSKRLHMDKNREHDDNAHHDAHHDDSAHDDSALHDDSARLQNIVLFLKDIRGAVESMDKDLWMRLDPGGSLLADVRAERTTLRVARHGAEYRSGIFKPHGKRTSLAFVLAVQHDLLALTLEILTRESVTGAAQVQRDAFQETFSELDRFMETERRKGHIIEIAEMVVEALRPVAQQLGLLASTPEPEPEPPNQLPMASSGAVSSSTAQGAGVDPEQELRAGDNGVTPDQLPLTSSGSASSLAMEGVTMAADAEILFHYPS
ncbi:hypothetical protein DFH94DRAFT_713146 [Russula ochroleuca]|uniref:DUF6535 domain-containing protein n=1 Tax=Russula ochroleuca TaxID=152965 RepID=A0A9P5N507_9AGAM|nr:hypothetical protein DFH94DRAFT_713146 [Russula ochroleuca]